MKKRNHWLGLAAGLIFTLLILTKVSAIQYCPPVLSTAQNYTCIGEQQIGQNVTYSVYLNITNTNLTSPIYLTAGITPYPPYNTSEYNVTIQVRIEPDENLWVWLDGYPNWPNETKLYIVPVLYQKPAPWNLTIDLPTFNNCSWSLADDDYHNGYIDTGVSFRVTNYTTCVGQLLVDSCNTSQPDTCTGVFWNDDTYIDWNQTPDPILASILAAGAGVVLVYTLKRRSSG